MRHGTNLENKNVVHFKEKNVTVTLFCWERRHGVKRYGVSKVGLVKSEL